MIYMTDSSDVQVLLSTSVDVVSWRSEASSQTGHNKTILALHAEPGRHRQHVDTTTLCKTYACTLCVVTCRTLRAAPRRRKGSDDTQRQIAAPTRSLRRLRHAYRKRQP